MFDATPEQFAADIRELRRNMDIISVAELLAGFENPTQLPKRPLCITFDDGYADNVEHALPILMDAGVPACFFLTTGLIGTRCMPWFETAAYCLHHSRAKEIPSPFGGGDLPYPTTENRRNDSLNRFCRNVEKSSWSCVPKILDELKEQTSIDPAESRSAPLFMCWDGARALVAAGMEVGGHSRTHPILSGIEDSAELTNEISGCYQDLKREIGTDPIAFSYPCGLANTLSQRIDNEVRSAGFRISFSAVHAFMTRQPRCMFQLPRIHGVHDEHFRTITWELARTRLHDC